MASGRPNQIQRYFEIDKDSVFGNVWVFNDTRVYRDPHVSGAARVGDYEVIDGGANNTRIPSRNFEDACLADLLYQPNCEARAGTLKPPQA